jgi:hypothetical protein
MIFKPVTVTKTLLGERYRQYGLMSILNSAQQYLASTLYSGSLGTVLQSLLPGTSTGTDYYPGTGTLAGKLEPSSVN